MGVLGVGEPRLEIGRAAVGREELALPLHPKRLRTGHSRHRAAVDEHVRHISLDVELRGLRIGTLEDGALRDTRADHHRGEDERQHGPHESQGKHLSTSASGPSADVNRRFRLAETT